MLSVRLQRGRRSLQFVTVLFRGIYWQHLSCLYHKMHKALTKPLLISALNDELVDCLKYKKALGLSPCPVWSNQRLLNTCEWFYCEI
jgi:hypothetical protein